MRDPSLSRMCRTCLQTEKSELRSINAIDCKTSLRFIDELLMCIPELACVQKRVSDMICTECIMSLRATLTFRNRCLNADKFFSELTQIINDSSVDTSDNRRVTNQMSSGDHLSFVDYNGDAVDVKTDKELLERVQLIAEIHNYHKIDRNNTVRETCRVLNKKRINRRNSHIKSGIVEVYVNPPEKRQKSLITDGFIINIEQSMDVPSGPLRSYEELMPEPLEKMEINVNPHETITNSESSSVDYKCLKCDYSTSLTEEIIFHHQQHERLNKQRRNFEESWNNSPPPPPPPLNDPLTVNLEETCSICEQGFTNDADLNQHLMEHSLVKLENNF